MPKIRTTGATGYLFLGATLKATTIIARDDEYEIATYFMHNPIEDLDLGTLRFITDHNIRVIAKRFEVTLPEGGNDIPLLGPNGGLTKIAEAINKAPDRYAQVHTLEAWVRKMDARRATDILAGLAKTYAASTAVAA